MNLLIKALLLLHLASYHQYEVIAPKDGRKIVSLTRRPYRQDHITDTTKTRLKVYMRADSVSYREDEIRKMKKKDL